MRTLAALVSLAAGVGCCGRGGPTGKQTPPEAEVTQMDANNNDPGKIDAAASAPAAAGEWKRVEIARAGISIEHRTIEWATLEDKQMVYQRFSNEGAISVRWGDDATIEYVLAHTGMGSGSTRAIEADEATTVDGLAARRVKLRVTSPPVHGTTPTGDPVRIFVFVGFEVGGKPVLVGYRSPASELPAVEPLLDRVLGSVKKL